MKNDNVLTADMCQESCRAAAKMGYRHEPAIVSMDIYQRLQKAIKEGAKPSFFSVGADIIWFVWKWENRHEKT